MWTPYSSRSSPNAFLFLSVWGSDDRAIVGYHFPHKLSSNSVSSSQSQIESNKHSSRTSSLSPSQSYGKPGEGSRAQNSHPVHRTSTQTRTKRCSWASQHPHRNSSWNSFNFQSKQQEIHHPHSLYRGFFLPSIIKHLPARSQFAGSRFGCQW